MSKPQARYDRHTGPRDRSLRVGDQEREAVSEILRREHVNGRIDAVEFQERLDRCLTARTYGDLDTLVADLPGDDPPRRRHTARWAPRPWPVGVLPLIVIGLIVASGGRALWLAFPLFFALFVLRPRGYRGHRRW